MNLSRVSSGSLAAALLLAACGCTTQSSLPVYDGRQVGTPITVQPGRVVAVRDVIIAAPSTRIGAPSTGAQIGAAVGASAVTGNVVAIGNTVGRIVGGKIGAHADDTMGEEITIEIEGGRRIVIVQERSNPPFAVDEPIELQTARPGSGTIYGGGTARVVRPAQFAGTIIADTGEPARPVRRINR